MLNILITGGTDGMGRCLAERLAGAGRFVLVMGRNTERGHAVEKSLSALGSQTEFIGADLSTRAGMKEAAEEVHKRVQHLDVLVHSAGGLFSSKRRLTEDGLELSFAIQVLARFVLTRNLMPLLKAAEQSRVLMIAGGGEKHGDTLDLQDIQGEKSHSFTGAIRKQAMANDLLTAGLIAHFQRVRFFDYGPGLVRTKVTMPNLFMKALLTTVGRLFSRSADDAAGDIAELVTGDHPSGFYGPGPRKRQSHLLQVAPGLESEFWDYLLHVAEES